MFLTLKMWVYSEYFSNMKNRKLEGCIMQTFVVSAYQKDGRKEKLVTQKAACRKCIQHVCKACRTHTMKNSARKQQDHVCLKQNTHRAPLKTASSCLWFTKALLFGRERVVKHELLVNCQSFELFVWKAPEATSSAARRHVRREPRHM